MRRIPGGAATARRRPRPGRRGGRAGHPGGRPGAGRRGGLRAHGAAGRRPSRRRRRCGSPRPTATRRWPALDPAVRDGARPGGRRGSRTFHRRQRRDSWFMEEAGTGVLGQLVRPLDRVGLYVPGGSAAYPSSVLMNAIPATVAGVAEIVICTPAGPDGKVPPAVLAAARAGRRPGDLPDRRRAGRGGPGLRHGVDPPGGQDRRPGQRLRGHGQTAGLRGGGHRHGGGPQRDPGRGRRDGARRRGWPRTSWPRRNTIRWPPPSASRRRRRWPRRAGGGRAAARAAARGAPSRRRPWRASGR